MDKETRNAVERATQRGRKVLEDDFAAQLEGTYDVLRTGALAQADGAHLSARQRRLRGTIVAAIEHKEAAGMKPPEAVADYLRDAAFTALNRFVALKMLEARELVQECISRGEQSSGYKEFCGMAPGVALLPEGAGYRLYIESLFDELSTEVKVLFDRRDAASALWPRRPAFEELLAVLNAPELARVWGEDETLGWVYQYFNAGEERRAMREASQAPRNSRELAVRNQFFTPRYVVEFLTDNTLGRLWYEMRRGETRLASQCAYLVRRPNEVFLDEGEGAPEPGETAPEGLSQEEVWKRPVHVRHRPKRDPRDLKVLDPACGSGHFLLYAFDLLVPIYEEGWADAAAPASEATKRTLREDHADLEGLRRALPGLVLRHNLHGVDIDARCAQIAQLALWMRAQRAYRDFGVPRGERPAIRRSNIVVAEPMPGEDDLVRDFVKRLDDAVLRELFTKLVESLKLGGDLGLLLRVERLLAGVREGQLGLFRSAEDRLRETLVRFAEEASSSDRARRRLFAEDAAQGLGLVETAEKRFDVVLMNPPFGAGSTAAKKEFEKAYPRTKSDVYAAFVERGIELLRPRARLGAITSRTGFFLSSFQKWREEILLEKAPPVVFADLGYGVLDSAMVETAAYCLEVSA
ncbi:DNA methyltransferase [Sorangium sp. So ce321]|uniref:Eco57I restriction-modification methylase domain-containing protein n=1 Tax=Sorangium sp. So ce321 TaxID=3133300 RepID=UPI003F6086A9